MAKMRISQHSGREGGGKHNDRQFDIGKAEHINAERVGDNLYWRWDAKSHPERTFDESELAFYAERYGVAQEAKNARYVHEGHADRCKSTDDLARGKQTRPEEIILQIGSKDAHVSDKQFLDAVNDYLKELQHWNREHGNHMQILSIAVHYDETTPHAHIRRTWDIEGRDGAILAQNKALKAAGVPLPDEHKPEGRYNNRKMSLDAEFREKWLDICERRGIEVEREPVPDMRHKDKAEFVREQIGGEIDRLKDDKAIALQEAAQAREDASDAREEASMALSMMEQAKEQEQAFLRRTEAAARSEREAKAKADAEQLRLEQLQAKSEEIQQRTEVILEEAGARLEKVKEHERVLSEREVKDVPHKETWGGRVTLSREDFDELRRAAGLAEQYEREILPAREINSRAQGYLKDARAQADKIVKAAEDRADSIAERMESANLRNKLDSMNKVLDASPQLRQAFEQQKASMQSRQHTRERDDFEWSR